MDSFIQSLLPRPSSAEPVPPPSPEFIRKLDTAIHTCHVKNKWREQRYGDEAEESRAGFTPDDVRKDYEKRQDNFKRLDALPTPGSYSSSDTQSHLHTTPEIRSPTLPVEVEDSSLAVPTPTFACADAEAPTNGYNTRKRRYSQTSPHRATDHHVRKKRPKVPEGIVSTRIFFLRRWRTRNDSGKSSRATLEEDSSICQPTADFLRNCSPQDLKSLQRSSRHGGPDLSNLRGVRYIFH